MRYAGLMGSACCRRFPAAPSILPKSGWAIAHPAHPPLTPLMNEKKKTEKFCWLLTWKIGFENQILAFFDNSTLYQFTKWNNFFWPKTFLILHPSFENSISHITIVVSSSVKICRRVTDIWRVNYQFTLSTFPVIQKYKDKKMILKF